MDVHMHDAQRTSHRASLAVMPNLGFRRIEHVRVIVDGGRAFAEVTGITHRYPRTFRVPLASAIRLADAGVPVRIETRSESTPATSAGRAR